MTEEENIGFDEAPTLEAEDLVVLERDDGTELECVLLAVFEQGEQAYALLTPRAELEDDGDLLVVRYAEDDDGTARFAPLADDAELASIRDTVAGIIDVTADDAVVPTFSGPVGEA